MKKPLIYLKEGDKFTFEGTLHTVGKMDKDANMVEVFRKGEFTVWPLYNGKEFIKVQPFIY